jgi:predicted Zn-dependent protease with MMP-like domain
VRDNCTYTEFARDFYRKIGSEMVEFSMSTGRPNVAEKARRARFRKLVERTVRGLPDGIIDRLENVEIVVDDEPTPEQIDARDGDSGELFGIYEGTPLSQRGSSYTMVVPDRIVIFRGPLERACANPSEIAEEVRITVLHELAHHFGFDEDEIEELGLA